MAVVKFFQWLTIFDLDQSSFKLEVNWLTAVQTPSTFATARHLPCSFKPDPYALRNGHKLTRSPTGRSGVAAEPDRISSDVEREGFGQTSSRLLTFPVTRATLFPQQPLSL